MNVTLVEVSFWFCLLASFIPYAMLSTKIVFADCSTILQWVVSRDVFTKNAENVFLVFLWGFLPHKRGERDCAKGVQKLCILIGPWDLGCQKDKCVKQNVSILKAILSVKPSLVLQMLGLFYDCPVSKLNKICDVICSPMAFLWYFNACLVYLLWSWSY